MAAIHWFNQPQTQTNTLPVHVKGKETVYTVESMTTAHGSWPTFCPSISGQTREVVFSERATDLTGFIHLQYSISSWTASSHQEVSENHDLIMTNGHWNPSIPCLVQPQHSPTWGNRSKIQARMRTTKNVKKNTLAITLALALPKAQYHSHGRPSRSRLDELN